MFVPSLITTRSTTGWEFAVIQAIIFLGGMLALLGVVFLVSFLFAPYRQRNEARALLSAMPAPVALPNRTELIKSINQLKETAIAYIWSKESLDQLDDEYMVHTLTENKVEEAYTNYQRADKRLEEESLVAGASFRQCISSFQNKVKLHVWIRYYEHEIQVSWNR